MDTETANPPTEVPTMTEQKGLEKMVSRMKRILRRGESSKGTPSSSMEAPVVASSSAEDCTSGSHIQMRSVFLDLPLLNQTLNLYAGTLSVNKLEKPGAMRPYLILGEMISSQKLSTSGNTSLRLRRISLPPSSTFVLRTDQGIYGLMPFVSTRKTTTKRITKLR